MYSVSSLLNDSTPSLGETNNKYVLAAATSTTTTKTNNNMPTTPIDSSDTPNDSARTPVSKGSSPEKDSGAEEDSGAAAASTACQWDGCGLVFPDAEVLYQHLCQVHVGRKSQKNLQLSCHWADCSVVTTKRDHITSHIRVHVPSKPYGCSNCSKKFKRSQDLKKHLKVHFKDIGVADKKKKVFKKTTGTVSSAKVAKPCAATTDKLNQGKNVFVLPPLSNPLNNGSNNYYISPGAGDNNAGMISPPNSNNSPSSNTYIESPSLPAIRRVSSLFNSLANNTANSAATTMTGATAFVSPNYMVDSVGVSNPGVNGISNRSSVTSNGSSANGQYTQGYAYMHRNSAPPLALPSYQNIASYNQEQQQQGYVLPGTATYPSLLQLPQPQTIKTRANSYVSPASSLPPLASIQQQQQHLAAVQGQVQGPRYTSIPMPSLSGETNGFTVVNREMGSSTGAYAPMPGMVTTVFPKPTDIFENSGSTFGIYQRSTGSGAGADPELSGFDKLSIKDESHESSGDLFAAGGAADVTQEEVAHVLRYLCQDVGLFGDSGADENQGVPIVLELDTEGMRAVCDYLQCTYFEMHESDISDESFLDTKHTANSAQFVEMDYPTLVF